MQDIINFIAGNWAVIASALFALSEVLSLIPSIKANGVFQLILGLIQKTSTK